ncbi:MAG: hypothetical protein ACRC7S_16975 [Cetobacterium sp.]|uniref:hypothetical protein n=1 Tax=unclassified Cetobacterium TaxID=2630983 RepID=UPI0006461C8D|nr:MULTISPECIES: hypothetical protein [unclassified Cetobacterium]
MFTDYTKDILRSLLAIVLGITISKYTSYSFSFEIPIIALSTVTTMKVFNFKNFIKQNCWLVIATAFGLLASEIFKEKFILFFIFTFSIFFSCFYYIYLNPKISSNIILGYSFTTIYSTYNNLNIETMVYDVFIVTTLGGILGFFILLFLPNSKEEKIKAIDLDKKTPNINLYLVVLISILVSITWFLYILFDIKDAFFAFATLAIMYGNLDLKKIQAMTPLIIKTHILGCFIAILYSFLVIGLSKSIFFFTLSLSLIFFPMLYLKYYGETNIHKTIGNGLIAATILPVCLYLNPKSDIAGKAGTRALQITFVLLASSILIKFLISLGGNKYEK